MTRHEHIDCHAPLLRKLNQHELARVNEIHRYEYDPQYPTLATCAMKLLRPHLPADILTLHIGSTAIVGMPGKGSLDIGVVCKSTTDQEYIARNLESITSTPDELGWIQANSTDFVRYGIMQHSGGTSPNIPVLIHVLTRENPRLAEFLIIQLLSGYPSFFHKYKAVKERAFESQDRFVYGRARREFLGTVTSYALDTIRPYLPQSSGEIDPNIEMSTFLIEQLNSPDTFVQSEAGKALNLFANNHFCSMQKALYQAP